MRLTGTSASPSLRRRLLLSLLAPGLMLGITLGTAGSLLIDNVVTQTHDRLLDAALLTIIERIGVEDGEVSVDIPLAALRMLESGSQDSVYYSVLYDGAVVTGYSDLLLTDELRRRPFRTVFWNGVYRGATIRLAGQMDRVYGKPDPVLVVVAQTDVARRELRQRLLLALGFMETALLVLVGALAWFAIVRGLRPLKKLSDDIDARGMKGHLSFAPLNLDTIPLEALPPARAFNALLGRLEASVGAIQRFTADASHQMRTPLAVMRTHLTLARRNLGSPAMAQTALTETEDAVRRLDHMVYQLIALARADETANDAADLVCDLGVVVTELVADRVPGSPEGGHRAAGGPA